MKTIKINEFNHKYASLEDSMEKFDLTGTMTDDGVLLSVDTEVTIDGKVVSTSVSEALNAFYTYASTVMSSRIEADYIASKYGIDIDYESLVKNYEKIDRSAAGSGYGFRPGRLRRKGRSSSSRRSSLGPINRGHPFLGGYALVAQKKYQQKFASTVNFPQLKKDPSRPFSPGFLTS